MKIICWNIQQLNITKAALRSGDIASAVAAAANGEPFILFVLEAQQDAQRPFEVASCIGRALAAQHNIRNIYVDRVDLGGDSRRQEDIVVVAGNGAYFSNFGAFTVWHEAFKLSCEDQVKSAQANEAKRKAKTGEIYNVRETVQRSKFAQKIEQIKTLPATAFRNPASFLIGDGTGKPWTVLVVHSPGPADGENYSKINYAQHYNKAVLSAALRFQIVMGDFNQDGDITTNLVDRTKGSGGTTKKHDGNRSVHRYDRVFSNIAVQVAVGTDNLADRKLTHHLFTVTTVPVP